MPSERLFSFRSLLTAITLSLVVVSIGGIVTISFFFQKRTIEKLGNQIVARLSQNIEDRIETLMRSAIDQNDLNSRLVTTKGALSAEDFRALFPFLVRSFQVQGSLSNVGLALQQTGEYCQVQRAADGSLRVRAYVNAPDGKRVIHDFELEGQSVVGTSVSEWNSFDPRRSSFYETAVKAGKSVWTETYEFSDLPGITYATPIFNPANQLLGVWNVDFDTRTLCQFLKRLDDEFTGYSVVFEVRADGEMKLIAHPDMNVVIDAAKGQEAGKPLKLDDPVTARLMQVFRAQPTVLAAKKHTAGSRRDEGGIASGVNIDFEEGGKSYLCALETLRDPGLPRWVVATVLPKDEIAGELLANRKWGIALLVFASTAMGFVAIRVARLVGGRMRLLQQEAQRIGRLELDSKPMPKTMIREFDHLSRAMTEMKTNLRSFSKYVPSDLVRDLVSSGREAELGGRLSEVSIYFSDIEDFTPTAEKLAPDVLVDHLGEYLGAMSAGIARHGGTLDKFMGDAVMAFWNAPRPNPEHALDACRAALANLRALTRLQVEWAARGTPLFHTRFGLHTGDVVVGNIGSNERMNYTIIGDAVNMTSRLQSLNKIYGTRILVSGQLFAKVAGFVVVRPVERVSPKGLSAGELIYELAGLRGDVSPEIEERCERTAEAHELYVRREFSAAAAIYRDLLASGDVTVSKVMLQRCEAHEHLVPPDEWDGTWNIDG
ncbi:MAG TPA: adenylate/guanylate cyclase domain-containing protein [Chthoniobacterales bacterium]